ncbi:hypothetical protein GJU40_14785 [Bacillus lacus]|uniref:Regulatory protein YycH domain-containing protein n=1 Tax=Metabacillus lacus TaxID=1983721 RepID=A0A7X2J185_9BACI|nr:two-component system activity regulator YycH [Metabacillus lacus]MRX73409.1 hypothetical protein [Metabacillus lacus]
MKHEQVKSFLLIVLIAASLFFTWNIWTYQPNYDFAQNPELLPNEPINSEQRSTIEVVKPYQMFMHQGGQHFGTYSEAEINKLWTSIGKWEITDTRDVSANFSKEEFISWVHGEDQETKLEVLFSDNLPIETFQSLLNWGFESSGYVSFDRMVLPVTDQQDQQIYLVSYEEQKIFQLTANAAEAKNIVSGMFQDVSAHPEFFAHSVSPEKVLLLPKERLNFQSIQIVTETIKGDVFKQALFSNPSIVNQDTRPDGERYFTDGTRVMEISPYTGLVKYIDPTVDQPIFIEAKAIQQSINYLNNHGGWTDTYRFFRMNLKRHEVQEVSFQLFINNLFVLPDGKSSMPTEITQVWGNNEIASYTRPSYRLRTNLSDGENSSIESGDELLARITRDGSIDLSSVVRIMPVYELSSSAENMIVELNPVWSIEDRAGSLKIVNDLPEKLGGNTSGLE